MGKRKDKKRFTTKSNNLQYSLAFYLSLEEYKYYLLPNIDTNYRDRYMNDITILLKLYKKLKKMLKK